MLSTTKCPLATYVDHDTSEKRGGAKNPRFYGPLRGDQAGLGFVDCIGGWGRLGLVGHNVLQVGERGMGHASGHNLKLPLLRKRRSCPPPRPRMNKVLTRQKQFPWLVLQKRLGSSAESLRQTGNRDAGDCGTLLKVRVTRVIVNPKIQPPRFTVRE